LSFKSASQDLEESLVNPENYNSELLPAGTLVCLTKGLWENN